MNLRRSGRPGPVILLSLALMCLTVGCQRAATPTATATVTRLATSTPSAPATHTPRSTRTPFPTPTATPQPSRTLTPSMTWTPLPPVSESIVIELMADNGGCRLPCWWGITPGETTWSLARQSLERFSTVIQNNQWTFFAYFWNPGTDDSNTAIFTVENDAILHIQLPAEVGRDSFRLPQLLAAYGPPEMAYVRKVNSGSPDYRRYYLFLYYPTQRFLAKYTSDGLLSENTVCTNYGAELDLWAPAEAETAAGVTRLGMPLIETVFTYDAAQLYEALKEPSEKSCLPVRPPK
jgi:hypothetical protein